MHPISSFLIVIPINEISPPGYLIVQKTMLENILVADCGFSKNLTYKTMNMSKIGKEYLLKSFLNLCKHTASWLLSKDEVPAVESLQLNPPKHCCPRSIR
jgi:hypothetical protein